MFISGLLPQVSSSEGVDVAICVPFTDLQAMVDSTRGSRVQVFAQNMHHAAEGAFTGEISAAMLTELDVHGVVLGHSERRAVLRRDRPRTRAEGARRARGRARPDPLRRRDRVRARGGGHRAQAARARSRRALDQVPRERLAEVVIAYEPIWAIGTGKVATPEQAQEACAFVRALRRGDRRRAPREAVRVQYGGSVKPDNAAELLALPDVDGALVGGAALDPTSFAAIVEAAACMTGAARSERRPGHPRRLGPRAARAGQRGRAGATPRSSTRSGSASRTRSSPPAAAPSACPRGRWATARSATSTSAPARSCART